MWSPRAPCIGSVIGLEDATGAWGLETGSGDWEWSGAAQWAAIAAPPCKAWSGLVGCKP